MVGRSAVPPRAAHGSTGRAGAAPPRAEAGRIRQREGGRGRRRPRSKPTAPGNAKEGSGTVPSPAYPAAPTGARPGQSTCPSRRPTAPGGVRRARSGRPGTDADRRSAGQGEVGRGRSRAGAGHARRCKEGQKRPSRKRCGRQAGGAKGSQRRPSRNRCGPWVGRAGEVGCGRSRPRPTAPGGARRARSSRPESDADRRLAAQRGAKSGRRGSDVDGRSAGQGETGRGRSRPRRTVPGGAKQGQEWPSLKRCGPQVGGVGGGRMRAVPAEADRARAAQTRARSSRPRNQCRPQPGGAKEGQKRPSRNRYGPQAGDAKEGAGAQGCGVLENVAYLRREATANTRERATAP
jgi:hypothetical protein